jgi:hypothetical protein
MRRRLAVLAISVATIALIAAPSAGAAVEFGDTCVGNEAAPVDATVTTLLASGESIPSAAPSAGVVTQVKMRVVPVPFGIPSTVKVLRPAGSFTFTNVGEAPITGTSGVATAPARIPVQAGDRLGLHGTPFAFGEETVFTVYCETEDGSVLGATPGSPPVNSTANYEAVEEGRAPVSAILEPDADNDGYGDETQDGCPQAAAAQSPCPPVALDAARAIKKKGSVVVLVTASSSASVNVTGTANLGKGKKAKLKSKARTVVPGKVSRFTLKFPKKLKDRLKELEKKRSLALKVTAKATDVAARVTTDKLTVKVKGQAK